MVFGSLVHHLILEPESFEQYYFVADKLAKKAKDNGDSFENFTLDMIEFGLRVYQSSQEKNVPDEQLK